VGLGAVDSSFLQPSSKEVCIFFDASPSQKTHGKTRTIIRIRAHSPAQSSISSPVKKNTERNNEGMYEFLNK
jgi:hypothetical protein